MVSTQGKFELEFCFQAFFFLEKYNLYIWARTTGEVINLMC